MFYIQQTNGHECGFTCLKMLLANNRKDKRFLFLPNKDEEKVYSFQDLINEGKNYGLEICGLHFDEKFELYNYDSLPVIVSVKMGEGLNHSMLLYKIKGKRFFFLDPNGGKKILNEKNFFNIWDGNLLFVKDDEYSPYPFESKEPIKKKNLAIVFLMQAIAAIIGIFAIYFTNSKIQIYYPLILLSLMLVVEIVMKIYIAETMKNSNKEYFHNLDIKKENYYKLFLRFEEYKKTLFSSPLDFSLKLVTVLFVMFIVVLNDFHNLALIITPIVFAILDFLFIKPYLKDKENKIAIREKALDNSEGNQVFCQNVKDIHDDAYKYARFVNIKQILYFFIMAAVALLSVFMCKTVTLPYVVFYFFVETLLFENLTSLLEFENKLEDAKIKKARLMNIYHQNVEKEW